MGQKSLNTLAASGGSEGFWGGGFGNWFAGLQGERGKGLRQHNALVTSTNLGRAIDAIFAISPAMDTLMTPFSYNFTSTSFAGMRTPLNIAM